jgi:hypothetical protein
MPRRGAPVGAADFPSDFLDHIRCKHRYPTLVVRMEVRSVMRAAGLDEHPDDDSEEATDLRH